MMNAVTFEEQTEKIVEVLFYDLIHEQSGTCFRGLEVRCEGLRGKDVCGECVDTFSPDE